MKNAGILLFSMLLIFTAQSSTNAQAEIITPGIYAEYGLTSVAPENTIPAIEGAYQTGFGVSVRAHMTNDGKIVIIRDKEVRHTTSGTGLVRMLMFEDLRTFDAGSWYDKKFSGVKVPSLHEVLKVTPGLPDGGRKLILECMLDYEGIEDSLAVELKRNSISGGVIITGIPKESAGRFHKKLPQAALSMNVHDRSSFFEACDEPFYDFLFAEISEDNWLEKSNISRASSYQKQVIAVLTGKSMPMVSKIEAARRLAELPIAGILTDIPIFIYKTIRDINERDYHARIKQKKESEQRREMPAIVEKDRMSLIAKGIFYMGSSSGEGYSVEMPYHPVYLDEFYIDKYEVTIQKYVDFLNAGGHDGHYHREMQESEYCGIIRNSDGSYSAVPGREDYPVTCVEWADAAAYAAWAGKRLPTEAEWEKAARGGLVGSHFPTGGISHRLANYNGVDLTDQWEYTAPVGSFRPNGYGIYDMSGNVWEWVQDYFHPGFYSADTAYNPVHDPKGDHPFKYRVIRGGCWADSHDKDSNLRVSARGPHYPIPHNWSNRLGFRCARTPQGAEKHSLKEIKNEIFQTYYARSETEIEYDDNVIEDSLFAVLFDNGFSDIIQKPFQGGETVSQFIPMDFDEPPDSKDFFLSLALPGAGELHGGRIKEGLAYLGIEALGWTSYFLFTGRGGRQARGD